MSSSNVGRRRRSRRAPQQSNRLTALIAHNIRSDAGLEAPILTPNRFGTTLRYYYNALSGASALVYPASLLNLIGVTKTTTTMSSIIEAVKISKVKMWLLGRVGTDATSASSAASCRLSVRDSAIPGIGVEKDIIVTTTGSKGRYYEYRFRGFASEWFNLDAVSEFGGVAPLFAITPNSGTTVYVEVDVALQLCVASSPTVAATLTIQTTVDTTVAGAVVFPCLDSLVTLNQEGSQLLTPFYGNSVTTDEVPAAKPAQSSLLSLPALPSSSYVPPRHPV